MATQPRVTETLRFDGYELDVRAGELRKHGVRLRLRGQPLQVLEILLERPGEVVTREELQARIWPGNAFGDVDHNLHNAVARIREVLGDSPENPRYIETLPRRGYRHVGPIQDFQKPPLAPETVDDTAPAVSLVAPPKRKSSHVFVFCAVLCALLALGLGALSLWLHAKA